MQIRNRPSIVTALQQKMRVELLKPNSVYPGSMWYGTSMVVLLCVIVRPVRS